MQQNYVGHRCHLVNFARVIVCFYNVLIVILRTLAGQIVNTNLDVIITTIMRSQQRLSDPLTL